MNAEEYEQIMYTEKIKKVVYFTIALLAMITGGIFYIIFVV
ncbi:MAG: hypothetical protein AABY07_06165 [Nanoarchaeota archaeon]